MSRSLRFIGIAVLAWAGVRAVSLGMVPGTDMLAVDRPPPGLAAAAALPPVERTDLTPPELAAPPPAYPYYAAGPGYPPPVPYYGYPPAAYASAPPQRVYHYAGYQPAAYRPAAARDQSAPLYAELNDYPGLPFTREPVKPLDQWPLAQIASGRSRRAPAVASSVPVPARFDRLQLSSWAMVRQKPGPGSLSTNGMLGGSQAGMRLLYRFNDRFAASLRTSVPLGTAVRGGEGAVGLRVQPFPSIPISVTAERRHAFGQGAGRSAFALFAEGGLWDRPIVAGFNLDAYVQGGVVGARRRDLFFDGGATLTRPLWRGLSVGGGVWGGVQPGLSRLDVGPRVSLRLRRGMRVHVDYRYQALGNAQPGSGAVVTLAGDF